MGRHGARDAGHAARAEAAPASGEAPDRSRPGDTRDRPALEEPRADEVAWPHVHLRHSGWMRTEPRGAQRQPLGPRRVLHLPRPLAVPGDGGAALHPPANDGGARAAPPPAHEARPLGPPAAGYRRIPRFAATAPHPASRESSGTSPSSRHPPSRPGWTPSTAGAQPVVANRIPRLAPGEARRGGETPRGRGADGREGARDGFRRVQRGDRTFCSRSDGGGDPLLHTIHRSAPGEPPGRARSDARPGARPVIRSQPIRVLAWMGQP